MLPEYFLHQLYPLQDKVLSLIAESETGFYLTGGTAVSRYYLRHRYSDDLDLFVNRAPDFAAQCARIQEILLAHYPQSRVALQDESFVRMFVWEGPIALKVEMINDVGYRVGEPLATPLFIRTDSWRNILANKITALSRNAPKDISDLLLIARNFSFEWQEAIEDARNKDTWVDELDVSQKFYDYPVAQMEVVNWVTPPDYEAAARDLRRMGLDVFEGGKNSLAPGA